MLSERKDEICSIIDNNGFAGIISSEDFDDFSNDKLADNWSNIEENENINHSEIDQVVNDFDKLKIIGDMSSDVSDDDNNDYTEKPKLGNHEIFQKIVDVGGFLG